MDVPTAVATIKGAIRSVTIWVAAGAEVAGELAPLFTPDALSALGLHAHTVTVICRVFAGIMIACRLITSKSLADKVSPPKSGVPENAKP